MRSTRHGSVCTQSAAPRRSSRRWSVVVLGMALPRSVAGPWRRTRRRDSGLTPMAPKVAPPRPAGCDQCRRAQDTLMTPMMTQIRATSHIPPLPPFETGSTVPATPMPMPIEPSARTTEAALRRAGPAGYGRLGRRGRPAKLAPRGGRLALAHAGVDAPVDLLADAVDQALRHGLVVLRAELAVRGGRRRDLVTGHLVHSLTIHLDDAGRPDLRSPPRRPFRGPAIPVRARDPGRRSRNPGKPWCLTPIIPSSTAFCARRGGYAADCG